MSYKMLEASLEKTAAEKEALASKIRNLEREMQMHAEVDCLVLSLTYQQNASRSGQ